MEDEATDDDNPKEPILVDVTPGLEFLQNYTYDQSRLVKKNDVIFYYDMESRDFVRVQVISKSNYRNYFNIKFLDIDRPDCGIYFRKNDFWSFSQPVMIQQLVPVDDQPHHHPPVEAERRSRSHRLSRQVSPNVSQHDVLRSDGVCVLPEDNIKDQLSPKSRRRARKLNLPPEQEWMRSCMARSLSAKPGSKPPQSRVAGFIDKILLGKK